MTPSFADLELAGSALSSTDSCYLPHSCRRLATGNTESSRRWGLRGKPTGLDCRKAIGMILSCLPFETSITLSLGGAACGTPSGRCSPGGKRWGADNDNVMQMMSADVYLPMALPCRELLPTL